MRMHLSSIMLSSPIWQERRAQPAPIDTDEPIVVDELPPVGLELFVLIEVFDLRQAYVLNIILVSETIPFSAGASNKFCTWM